MPRRTKIVATLGPASGSDEVIGSLIDAGMAVARLNLSHGSIETHIEIARRIRKLADERGKVVAVLADLPGPKIRTTTMGNEGIHYIDNSVVELCSGDSPSTSTTISTDYPNCAADLEVGDLVTLGDGGLDLLVIAVEGSTVKARVMNGGTMRGRPGLHMPSERISLPVPTDEDRELIQSVVLPAEVDFVAVSFVRNAEEMKVVRDLVGIGGPRIVAKIETPTAIDNLDEIVAESDAVMVARGDLGTECPFEDVPVYQKRIIQTCIAHAVPVITATQMLESMITASTPTRAEASDVANAVCDGTDAVMLSAETAVGHDPALVVRTMARIAERAEIVADFERFARTIGPDRRIASITAALTHGAWQAAVDARVSAIICCTRSGSTARSMATLRPDTKLLALAHDERTMRQEVLTWGVIPMPLPVSDNSDEMVADAVRRVEAAGHVREGEVVAVLTGAPGISGSTHVLRLLRVGQDWI